MTLRISAVLTLAAALLFVLSPQAMAQACQGRPGASAIEQYCEAIPEGTGERVTPSSERESRGSSSDVPAGTAEELADAGQEGQAVLGLAASSGGGNGGNSGDGESGSGTGSGASSSGGTSGSGNASAGDTASATPAASSPSDNPLKAVSSAVSNGATVGSAFLWGLLALALAAAGAAWIGFRRHQPPSES